jgi:hypothetical protein
MSAAKRYRLILSAVHMVYRLVNSTFTVKEFSLRLTRLLCQFVRASSASVYVLDQDKKRLAFAASYDNQINILRETVKELKSLPPQVMDVARGASVMTPQTIGLPLVADDYLGAIFVSRSSGDESFNDFDREMLSVFAEQAVTAIKNLQSHELHEKIILGSIKSIGNFVQTQGARMTHTPAYTQVVKMIAAHLNLSHDEAQSLEYASLLHDIGVIDIPFEILSKREALSSSEFDVIRKHTAKSVALIKPVEFLKPVLPVILYHHEKFDGTGYPSGLRREQIPIGARVIALVDAFEAMVQGRPYRAAISIDRAIDEIAKHSGTQFDPKIVGAFLILSSQKKFRKLLALLKH